MPTRFLHVVDGIFGVKSVFFSWVVTGAGTFGLIATSQHDALYAAFWASISGLLAAIIAGIVKVATSLIQTAPVRGKQREDELDNHLNRWHRFYAEKLAFKDQQLFVEMSILRLVRNSKHELVSDIGARDLHIDLLEDILLSKGIAFERAKFRNLGEAFKEEDEQVAELMKSIPVPRPTAFNTLVTSDPETREIQKRTK